jgi:hypothetical protein
MTAQSRFDESALLDPAQYTLVRGRTLFDEHTEYDAEGKATQVFNKDRLEKMADRNNRRARTGQLCPIAIGHTVDDEKDHTGKVTYKAREEDQPELVGYVKNYRVKFSKRLGKYVVRADWYIRNDKFQKAASFPRVSIERWKDDTIDPVSLLRRTPARDLGQWTYARSHHASVAGVYGNAVSQKSARWQSWMAEAVWRYAMRNNAQVVRYAMAENDDDRREEEDEEHEDRDREAVDEGRGSEEGEEEDPAAPAGAQHGLPDEEEEDGGHDGLPDGMKPKHYARHEMGMEHWMGHHPVGRYMKSCYDRLSDEERAEFEDHDAGPGPERHMSGGAAAGATNGFVPGDHDMETPKKHSKKLSPAEQILADASARRPAKKPQPPQPQDRYSRL